MKDISSSQHDHVAVNHYNTKASSESHVSEIHIMQFGIGYKTFMMKFYLHYHHQFLYITKYSIIFFARSHITLISASDITLTLSVSQGGGDHHNRSIKDTE